MAVDLSLYLVTDSTPEILGHKDLCYVVEEAVKGGVTVVQYRDKHSDTGVLVSTAQKLHEITKAHNVPLIINDRIDVALAVGAEGVHLGQDDMDIDAAKKLLPKEAIIGATVSSVEEALVAVQKGANYLGVGTVYATPTKKDTKSIIGTAGTRQILSFLSTMPEQVGTVAIGGINLSNAQRVIYQSQAALKGLDGVAIVSAIMAAEDPQEATVSLRRSISTLPSFATKSHPPRPNEVDDLLREVPEIVHKVASQRPLCHSMINFVVANFAANVTLAIGASPIMSLYGPEAGDLAKNGGALLINMGTLNEDFIQQYLQALRAYNAVGGPVVFDPVGAAATEVRRDAVRRLTSGGYFDLIKGNESELKFIYGRVPGRQVGVDSGPSTLGTEEKATMVRDLARRERNIVLLTGAVDYLSDGERVLAIGNGHSHLGQVTGTGCVIGCVAAAFLTVHRTDKLLAVLSALLMFEIAAENAATKDHVRGPGSFVPALLDELAALRDSALNKGEVNIYAKAAKVQLIPL